MRFPLLRNRCRCSHLGGDGRWILDDVCFHPRLGVCSRRKALKEERERERQHVYVRFERFFNKRAALKEGGRTNKRGGSIPCAARSGTRTLAFCTRPRFRTRLVFVHSRPRSTFSCSTTCPRKSSSFLLCPPWLRLWRSRKVACLVG